MSYYDKNESKSEKIEVFMALLAASIFFAGLGLIKYHIDSDNETLVTVQTDIIAACTESDDVVGCLIATRSVEED